MTYCVQIFGQRVLCHRTTHQFDFDPPLLAKHQVSDFLHLLSILEVSYFIQTGEQIYQETKEWLISCRLDNYIHTDIYIESLLGLLLTKADDAIGKFIQK